MLNPTSDSYKKIKKREERDLKQISEEITRIASAFPLLTPEEEGFIRARVSYLTKDQAKLFTPLFTKEK